jgi:hypothetical protein
MRRCDKRISISEWVDAERSRGKLNAESGMLSKIQDVVLCCLFVCCCFSIARCRSSSKDDPKVLPPPPGARCAFKAVGS